MAVVLPAIAAAASIGGSIVNFFTGMSAADRAKMLQDQAFKQWMALNIPDPDAQKLALQQFQSQGTLTPVLESAIKQDPTSMQMIVTDAGTKAAQRRALSSLQQIGDEGGLRLQDKVTLQEAQQKAI